MSADFSDLNGRLSKEWIPQRAVEPFYSGGPVSKQYYLPKEIKKNVMFNIVTLAAVGTRCH